MMKRFSFWFVLSIITLFSYSQQKKPEYIKKLENSAIKHFQMGDYLIAMHNYYKLYQEDSTNLYYMSQLAYSYINAERNIEKAIQLLKSYVKRGGIKNNDYYYHLGKAYMFDLKIEKATETLSQYSFKPTGDNKKDDKERIRANEVKRLLEMCYDANYLLSSPLPVKFENLGPNVNSSHDDYLPFIIDGNKLLFTSNKYYDDFYEVYTQNIYYSELKDGQWTFAKPMKKLNTEDNEELNSITSDGKIMFIRNNFYEDYSSILVAIRKGKTFKYPENNHIQEVLLDKVYYMGASYDVKSKTIYTAYANKYNGNYDIYKISELPNGTWGNPEKLPPEINTPYQEAYPVISASGDTLYFASKGHNSMGGYDIFYSVYKNGKWSQAVNLGYPINSTFDDYSIIYTNNGKYAYVSANRKGGYGGKDIYKISFQNKDVPLILIQGLLSIKTKNGAIKSFDNHPDDFYILVKNEDGDIVAKYLMQKNKNKFIAILPPGKYYFVFSYDGFKDKKVRIIVDETKKILQKEITLEKL